MAHRRFRWVPNHFRRRDGFSVISSLISMVILLVVALQFSRSVASVRKLNSQIQQNLQFGMYASELVEYFRSMRPNQVFAHLGVNPVTGATDVHSLYKLCAHINVLDRESGILANSDSIAALPEGLTRQKSKTNFDTRPNRFYIVQIVNLKTLQVNKTFCDRTTRKPGGSLMTTGDLGPDERIQVTVGVSWVTPSGPESSQGAVERVVLTTVIPG